MAESRRILVASSTDTFLRMLRFYFTKAGYEVETATSIDGALRMMPAHQPELVMVDEQLENDGFQLVRQFRASPVTSRLPVLMLVSGSGDARAQSAIANGATDAIRRDAKVQDIGEKVSKMLTDVTAEIAARPAADPGKAAHTVTVLGARGGSGKTLLATNLGVALAQRKGQTAVLLDLNLEFGTTAMMLNLRPMYTLRDLAEAAMSDVSDAEFDGMLLRHSSGLRVLPAVAQPGDSELIPDGSLPRIIERLRRLYDHVIVDGRPSFREFMLDLWENSDTLLICCPPEVIAVLVTRALLEAFGVINVDPEKVLLVINQVAPKARLTAAQVEKGLGRPTFSIPYGGEPLYHSVDVGKSYILERPNEPTAVAIRKLADKLVERYTKNRAAAAAASRVSV